VVTVYSVDNLNRHVLRGYGVCHVPVSAGRHTQYIRTFRPISSSLLQRFNAWITGEPPEFLDGAKFVAQGVSRDVTRVESSGAVKVSFNVLTKNMAAFGYSEAKPTKGSD
jgi:B9 domain-containing protein 1